MATYPSAYPVWTTKFDYTTVVYAEHINTLQTELIDGVQRTLGTTPQIARHDPGSTPFELLGVVDWIGEADRDNLDKIIRICRDDATSRHNFDPKAVLDALYEAWPQWAERYPRQAA
ncbi:hypothetical protein [Microbispora sp. NPDC049633]|uniref:hypothetical protein n=1 Tax=Microbispora sp. NPDC049633 TaxID=3154355 RepID=UPI00343178C8